MVLARNLALASALVVWPAASQALECKTKSAIYYERERGFYISVSRVGSTKQDYARSGTLLPGLVLYAIGPDKKPAYVHGPMLSSMFLDAAGVISPVEWKSALIDLPPSFRVMDDGGTKPLFGLNFLKCE